MAGRVKKTKRYGIGAVAASRPVAASKLPYRPRDPKRYRPAIGLIGCGGVAAYHLRAYRDAGYRVAALCDVEEKRAEERQAEFFPRAEVTRDADALIARSDIEVVDIATHPAERLPLVEAALRAGKHVLSQKPFALDLAAARRLVDLAEAKGLRLAVNQNGRWAPHWSFIRHAIARGLIGEVIAAHCSVHWNHNWVAGTSLDAVQHLVLFDFAVHWFDILTCFMGEKRPRRVYASIARSPGQRARPPLLGQALIEYEGAQATLSFDADAVYGAEDRTYIAGTQGTLVSVGKDLTRQSVRLYTKRGIARPRLEGTWFKDGFHGTMAELLCAIEEGREPTNSARSVLPALELCFAAVASAEEHAPKVPGEVGALPGGS